jgi:hypothetical protein
MDPVGEQASGSAGTEAAGDAGTEAAGDAGTAPAVGDAGTSPAADKDDSGGRRTHYCEASIGELGSRVGSWRFDRHGLRVEYYWRWVVLRHGFHR